MTPDDRPGTELTDADLMRRYAGKDSKILVDEAVPPQDYLSNRYDMADWIRRFSNHYPQDSIHADLLASRIVDYFKVHQEGMRKRFLWRPWLWWFYHHAFGCWPWEKKMPNRL